MNALEVLHRSQESIAQGCLTNSKHPNSFVRGVYPTHVQGGAGCYLFGCDNRRYTDYICGLGSNLFGYGNNLILERATRAASLGVNHSLPTLFEVETAETLKQIFFWVDRFKFLKTGGEACMAAIRMARAHTGRLRVLSDGYHGFSDEFVSLTPPATGVHRCLDIEKLDLSLTQDFKDVAAVIVEPVITDWSTERQVWLQNLKNKCKASGTLLIFDEVITGFRFRNHSVARHFNIIPDLIVLGKALGGGFPLAAVGGKSEVMDGDYFVSSTYAGDIVSLAACKAATLLLLKNSKYDIEKLADEGDAFIKRFNETVGKWVKIEGYSTRGVLAGSDLNVALFMQEAARAQFLFGKSWFYNYDLVKENYMFFSFLESFAKSMALGQVKLIGEMPKSPFSERVRSGSSANR